MPEIETECIFNVARINVVLRTQMNGDQLTLKGLHFSKETAAILAWLINNDNITSLEIQIKEAT